MKLAFNPIDRAIQPKEQPESDASNNKLAG
jgi:hypothetical protein